MKYTKKLHAHRLKMMLNRIERDPECQLDTLCPADYFDHNDKLMRWDEESKKYVFNELKYENDKCAVCREFIGSHEERKLFPGSNFKVTVTCPCHVLGCEEAIKRSVKALEEYYGEEQT